MRGVGYCHNQNCIDFVKGVFVMSYTVHPVYCNKCKREIEVVAERRDSAREDVIYASVEVDFDYNPMESRYMSKAIVSIEPKIRGETYHYSSPLVKTEKRALKIAESLINIINTGYFTNDSSISEESVLDLSKPDDEFKADLYRLDKLLKERERRLMNEG